MRNHHHHRHQHGHHGHGEENGPPRHGAGHNHAGADHLHSHPHGGSGQADREELLVLAAGFVEGFRAATDKTSYLRLAGIPFERKGSDGLTMHLVDASIAANWQIGTASPAFASRELVYMPFPGSMVSERETMRFTYVSLTQREDVDLVSLLAARTGQAGRR